MATAITRPHPSGLLWRVVKNKVFSQKPHMVDDMIRCISEACQEIDDNKCAKVCLSIVSRLQQCAHNEGQQLEPLQDCT